MAFIPEPGNPYWQEITIYVAKPAPDIDASPSLMDINALWNMNLEMSPKGISVTPINAN